MCVQKYIYTQIIITLLCILADSNNTVVWIVSTCPLISESYSLFTNLLRIVLSAPITVSITVTIMFHSFFLVEVLISLFAFFQFYYVGSRDGKVHNSAGSLFFLLTITSSVRLPRLKSQKTLCISFSWKNSGLCKYHSFVWSNINFLQNSQLTPLLTQLCLVLYYFRAAFAYYVNISYVSITP